jgi:hypothetical protein
MSLEQDMRSSWSHQFQGYTCGFAVDQAINMWRNIVGNNYNRHPDEIIVVGPFSITMRQEAVNKYNNVDGVWDITIRWYA